MMRRFYTMILAMLATVPAAFAQTIDGVVVENYTMERSGNYIIVDMDLDVSGVDVRNSEVVVLTPHIVRDTLSKDLRSIGIYGRNRHFYYERNEDLAPTSGDDLRFRSNKTPDKVQYHAVVSFEEWMDGCQLVFEREDCGCAGAVVGQSTSMLIDRFPMEPYRPQLIYVRPEAVAEKVYAISGSAFVDFPVSNMDINPEYRNNSSELAKITGTIDSVRGDKDVTIQSIFIKGYASPESPYANNERLAKGRTAALKEYVENMPDSQKAIYYASSDTIKHAIALPQCEEVRKRGYELLYLGGPLDEMVLAALMEQDGKQFINVVTDDLGFDTDEEKEAAAEKEKENKDFLSFVKEALGEAVADVRLSHKLASLPCCLTTEGGLTLEMEKYFRHGPSEEMRSIRATRVLELNGEHAAVAAVKAAWENGDSEKAKKLSLILARLAELLAGAEIEEPTEFAKLVSELF